MPTARRLNKNFNNNRPLIYGLLGTCLVIIFVASMVIHPKVVYQGAVTGLKTWWNIVFPSLLPFFIASELLMSFGVVRFMGVLLEPVMRPIFNVPGTGAFVMAIGFTSGYPIGAMVTARLRADNLCTRIEAERLLCFTNNSSPLFMLAAVSVGMFGRPELGIIIAGSHYLSNLTLGLLMRFYGRSDAGGLPPGNHFSDNLLHRAIRELALVWRDEKRPPGKILGDAVKNAVNNLLNIGGFIILFAVIIKLLTAAGFINVMAGLMGNILKPLGFSEEILPALSSGFFEMTIGCKMASDTTAPLLQQLAAVGIILAWSGLSIQAQVASMISNTDIRLLPFVCARVIHAALAAVYTFVLFGVLGTRVMNGTAPVMASLERIASTSSLWENIKLSGSMLLFILLFLLAVSLTIRSISKIKIKY